MNLGNVLTAKEVEAHPEFGYSRHLLNGFVQNYGLNYIPWGHGEKHRFVKYRIDDLRAFKKNYESGKLKKINNK